jgi:hypothetical protein
MNILINNWTLFLTLYGHLAFSICPEKCTENACNYIDYQRHDCP